MDAAKAVAGLGFVFRAGALLGQAAATGASTFII